MRTLTVFILLAMFGSILSAQVKIGQNPESIDPASILELDDDTKALVLTRISDANMNAMNPLRGALVYNTDFGCVYYYNGVEWLNLCNAGGGTTNESLVLQDNELILTDSEGGQVSVLLETITEQTFTADPIQNFRETILITQNGNNYNFEVLEITGEQIADFTIQGIDIAEESIRSNNLAPNSVGQSELSENSVADLEIDYSQVTLNDFTNDAGYITNAQIVSPDVGNDIVDSNGSYYDDSPLQTAIDTNTANLTQHLAEDNDIDPTNEIVTEFRLDGNNLILAEGTNTQSVSLDGFNNAGSDNQQLTLNGNLLTLEDGGTPIDLSPFTGTGTDDQDLGPADLNAANVLTIGIENGDPVSVDLSALAGGGAVDGVVSDVAFDGTNLNFTGANGGFNGNVDISALGGGGGVDGVISDVDFDGTNLNFTGANGGFSGNVDISALAGGGADGVVSNVVLNGTDLEFTGINGGFNDPIDLSSLGSTELADQTTISGDGSVGNEFRITPSLALGQYLRTDPVTGDVNWDDLPTGTTDGTVDSDGFTIVGDGQGTPLRLGDMGANNGQVIKWNTGAGTWEAQDDRNTINILFGFQDNPFSGNRELFMRDSDGNEVGVEVAQLQAEIGTGGGGNPTDEIQDLQLDGGTNILTITDNATATPIDLTPYLDNTDNQNAAAVDYDNATSGLTATTTQAAIDELAASGVVDTDEQQLTLEAGNLLTLEDGGTPIDLNFLLDNTDNQNAAAVDYENATSGLAATTTQAAIDELAASGVVDTDEQQLTLEAGNLLTLEDGGTPIDLNFLLDNTDNQNAAAVDYDNATSGLAATTAQAAIDELAASGVVDTDEQQLTLEAGNLLTLEDGGTPIDLNFLLDNTDNQNAAAVDYDNATSGLAATTTQAAIDELAASGVVDTDEQQLTLEAGNLLTLEDGGTPIDLNFLLDNTDNQNAAAVDYDNATSGLAATTTQAAIDELAASGVVDTDEQQLTLEAGNLLTLEDGGTPIDLNFLLDNTDNQNAAAVDYDNATSGLAATTTQAAIDELAASGVTDTNFALNNLTLDAARTHDLNGNDLTFLGTGSFGIGIAPANKFHVAGAGRFEGVLNSAGVFNEPSYRFAADTDTGMWNPAADEIAFSAGAVEAMRITEAANTTKVIIQDDLELNGTLTDSNGSLGNPGDVLTRENPGTGVVWEAPGATTDTNFANTPLTFTQDIAHNLSNNNLTITGEGNVIISGIPDNPNEAKLQVDGTINTTGIRNANGSAANNVSYSFFDDASTGMFKQVASNLDFATAGAGAIRINAAQNVGIGATFMGATPASTIDARLHVDGNIRANGDIEYTGGLVNIPDYVFQNYFNGFSDLKEDYAFKSLTEIEAFVKKHKHLPGVTSAAQAQDDGFWNLSQSNLQNLEKIEELFLHTIEQQKKIDNLSQENQDLKTELNSLKAEVEAIKAALRKQ